MLAEVIGDDWKIYPRVSQWVDINLLDPGGQLALKEGGTLNESSAW